MTETHLRAAAATVSALLLILAPGCGKQLPPGTDVNLARTALTTALDTWKAGRPVESLREAKPPVDFRDVQWERGARLAGYEITAEERSGLSVRFTVRLQFPAQDGKAQDRTVTYTADAGQVVVIRPVF